MCKKISKNYLAYLFICIFFFPVLVFGTQALLKPLPQPDIKALSEAARNDLVKARQAFEEAKPNLVGELLAEAYAKIGAEYARFGFNDIATISFHNASELSPYDGRWPYLEGVMALAKNQLTQARDFFKTALALDQAYLPIRLRLADVLIQLNQLDEAKKVLDELIKLRQDIPSPHAMLGDIALKQKRYKEAAEHLNQALKLDPQANQLYEQLATAYTAQGNSAAAKEAKALAGKNPPIMIDPLVSNMYAPKMSGSDADQAVILMKQHRFDEARQKLMEALSTNPKDVVALSIVARLESEAGNVELAKQAAEKAMQADPGNAIANLTNGMMLEIGGNEAQATAAYEKAIRADLKLPEPRLLLGNAEMRRNRFAQAVEQYRQLVALQPDNFEAHAHLAAAQVAANKCADALKDIKQTLLQRPKDGGIAQIFIRLASTCPAASPQDRTKAFEDAKVLYQQRPNGDNSEALAIAHAAQGKFQEAAEYQAQAIFEAVRNNDNERAAWYKSGMQWFKNKQKPDRPWSADHFYFKPLMLKAGIKTTTEQAQKSP